MPTSSVPYDVTNPIGWFLHRVIPWNFESLHARFRELAMTCASHAVVRSFFPNFHEQIVCIAAKALYPTRLKVRASISEVSNGARIMLVRVSEGTKRKVSSTPLPHPLKLHKPCGRHRRDLNPGPELNEPSAWSPRPRCPNLTYFILYIILGVQEQK